MNNIKMLYNDIQATKIEDVVIMHEIDYKLSKINKLCINIKHNKRNLVSITNNIKCIMCNRNSNYLDKNTNEYLCWIHSQ